MNVVIIGCGNIGSRLLQSVSNITDPNIGVLDISVVEPNEAGWLLVEERFNEVNQGNHSLSVAASDKDLPAETDLLIIPVDARNRLAALRSALGTCKPKNIVLEKVLFTEIDDYRVAQELVKKTGAQCWVNCTRNIWPGYADLKKDLAGADELKSYSVSGSNWNMASNAIHFLSVLEFLQDDVVSELSIDRGGVQVHEAKRSGYKEITGTLSGRLSKGAEFSLTSSNEAGHAVSIDIRTANSMAVLKEGAQEISWTNKPVDEFQMLHASQLNECFTDILLGRGCGLPELGASSALHLKLFEVLNEVFYGPNNNATSCPVT